MKILVVSDSHGRNTNLETVIKKVGPLDLFIHLGDIEGSEQYIESIAGCEAIMVSGNNDYTSELEKEQLIAIGQYTIFVTHGHRYQVNFGTEIIKNIARMKGADIVMYGHTHKPIIDTSDDVVLINPGSITQPRQDNHLPTYIIMEIDRFGEAHYTLQTLS